MTETLTKPDVDADISIETLIASTPYEDLNDPNHRAHIVNPPKNLHIWRQGMSAQTVVDTARLLRLEVVALCGYRWVPKHNPDKFDVCDGCMKIAGELMRGAGE